MRSNERLLAELRSLGSQVEPARRYLSGAGCNAVLGKARLDRLEAKASRVRARLRANRLGAHQILGGAEKAGGGREGS